MRTSEVRKIGWLVSVSVLWLGACAGGQDAATDSAAGAMSVSAPPPAVTDYGHCGKTGEPDCNGGLRGLPQDWAGSGQLGRDLAPAIAQRFGTVNFSEESQVAMRRKGKGGGVILTRVDAIDDAHTVFNNEIEYPVIMARFAVIRGNDVDNRFGASRDANKAFYFVVNPDLWDGTSTPNQSYWAVVEYHRNGTAKIVAEGQKFAPCSGNHPQKAVAFATFASCPSASLSFETLMPWRGVLAADSTKHDSLLNTLSPDVRAALRRTGMNDDPLWITCGLGCCSTQDES